MDKARIFVVEDESIVALDVKEALKNLGYDVAAVVSSGEDAVRQVAETHPDLILMDIKLKGDMDGVAAAKQIQTKFDLPVIYLTAYSDDDTLRRAKITAPYGYVLKPFEERELHTTIEMALHKHQLEQELKQYRNHLEKLVGERTTELTRANEQLRQEIVERKRVEQALYRAKEAAEAASQAKSVFLAQMSHELYTPLNVIIGYSERLQQELNGPLAPDQAVDVERIISGGHHLLTMLDGILDLTGMDAYELDIHLRYFAVSAAIDAIVAEMLPLAKEKGLILSAAKTDTSVMVYADETRLRQVLLSLVSNAIKFTPVGQVRIETSVMQDQIVISVSDTGIGIADTDLPYIFDIFHQVDAGLSRKYGGAGLGLALTKRLLMMMNGKIEVVSKVDQGSVFTVTLPATDLA